MNLAHAVACIAYELVRPDPSVVGPNSVESAPRLSAAARASFYAMVRDTCDQLNYPPGRSPDAFVRRLRKILHRANLNQPEISMLGGVFSELLRLGRLAGVVEEPKKASEREDDGG